MRPGLVVVGGLLATLGAAALASLYLLAPPAPTTTTSITGAPVTVRAGECASTPPISLVVSSHATLRVTWQSTTPLAGALTLGAPCSCGPSSCTGATVLASGTAQSAVWAIDSPGKGPVYLTWSDPGATNATVRYTVAETVAASNPLPAVTMLLIDIGLGSLTAIGGLALFLGMFLRGGVYQGGRTLVSRSAEDAEMVAADPSGGAAATTGPRRGSSGGGS